ncbi:uncharacterized protein LOC126733561 isoform X2 [Anthonomus grandis grandis]|uniref:uncharacterized protein LOC126733561 isoform X1 n=1 Tax=Anthonomus grandis grandis TaxID=2921223 RepID=UPI0021660C22|nr:uncharacterized protein LOC126733561 isoform X1 [Anthonomus grandis grandis]XP_050292868.1 uncharacterized protein LOC126733561 isoform X2 [Anthonomus grandis grandis]
MFKFSGFALIALVVLQITYSSSFAIDSTAKDGIVNVLEAINSIAFKIETYGDNLFAERLKNETGIKEWSATLQTEAATEVTKLLFRGYEMVKEILLAASPSDSETKLLNCISAEQDNILATVDSAFTNNGWCNNRLAANLTRGLKSTTAALLEINSEIKDDIETLNNCSDSDVECLAAYANQAVSLVKESYEQGDLGTGLKEVVAIYKIMFGEDIPRCNKEVLLPQVQEGLSASIQNVLECSTT